MLEIKRTAIGLDEQEVLELERIIIDADKEGALRFLKAIHNKITHSQQGRLKSHLDAANPVDGFKQRNK